MTIDHRLVDGVACLHVAGDLPGGDTTWLTVVVATYVRDPRCSCIEVELSHVFAISQATIARLAAMREIATDHGKAVRIVGSRGTVRAELQRSGLLTKERLYR